MKICSCQVLIALSCLLFAVVASATTYYIDPAGLDTNSGTTTTAPWKTLTKVNATTFVAGDQILFKAGGVWSGQLYPKGTGTSGSHIVINRYGTGAKPLIQGGGNTTGTVYLYNQEYWEVHNLEVTNTGASKGEYVGIKVRNDSGVTKNYILIDSCVVHNINGYPSGFYGTNTGIAVTADMNNSKWDTVVIQANVIYSVDRIGVFVGPSWQTAGTGSTQWLAMPKSTNVAILYNTIYDTGGDGILNFITDDTLIEGNLVHDSGARCYPETTNPTGYSNRACVAIWSVIADNTTMQFNEVYNFNGALDGEAFDIDMGTSHTSVQYNYSHDNLGGFVLIAESTGGVAIINDAKIRYNISQNDGTTKGVFHIGQPGFGAGADKTDINNNTVIVPAWASAIQFFRPYGVTTIPGAAYLYNNVFYLSGAVTYPGFAAAVFDYNVFYGSHPASEPSDAHKLTSDPLLVAPGSATYGLNSVDGYKLKSSSPALASGTYTNAASMGSQDYWGNSVASSPTPNRGAYNGAGVTGTTTNFAYGSTVSSYSTYTGGSWAPNRLVDGQRTSVTNTSGYSSQLGISTSHTEWVALNLGATSKTFSKVILYPRTTPGYVGEGFPVDFQIQVWNGSTWLTRVTVTGHTNPGSTPQVYTWGFSDTTNQVRVYATNLDTVGSDRVLQLAEIEVTN